MVADSVRLPSQYGIPAFRTPNEGRGVRTKAADSARSPRIPHEVPGFRTGAPDSQQGTLCGDHIRTVGSTSVAWLERETELVRRFVMTRREGRDRGDASRWGLAAAALLLVLVFGVQVLHEAGRDASDGERVVVEPTPPAQTPPPRETPRVVPRPAVTPEPAPTPVVRRPLRTDTSLRVTSTPSDARVVVDNVERGRTPILLEGLSRGRHRVRVELDRFEVLVATVETRPREVTGHDVRLDRSRGMLLVERGPAGARLVLQPRRDADRTYEFTLDGFGALPATEIETGTYDVQAIRPGFDVAATAVRIAAGSREQISLRTTQRSGSFAIDSRPRGARVSVNGREIGTTPIQSAPIAAGSHEIALALNEHEGQSLEMTVRGDELRSLGVIHLTPWPEVSRAGLPPETVVTIDGVPLTRARRLRPGTYAVELTRPGYVTQRRELSSRLGEPFDITGEAWVSVKARLDIGTLPEGVTAKVNGRPVEGVLTYDDAEDVVVVLSLAGHESQEHELLVTPGRTIVLQPREFKKPSGLLTQRRDARSKSSVEEAVGAALAWLSRHQDEGGEWDNDTFDARCQDAQCAGPGDAGYGPGVSALAVLAFQADGHSHRLGAHREAVQNGLLYLRTIQDDEGCFGPRSSRRFLYNHAAGTLAVADAYALTRGKLLEDSTRRAVGFIERAQSPYLGWRYGLADGESDTSSTAWMTTALRAAADAGIEVSPRSFSSALTWIDRMTEPEFGRVGYRERGGPPFREQAVIERFPADRTEPLTAAAVLARLAAGQPRDHDLVEKGAALLVAMPPIWDVDKGTIDFTYWLHGAAAMQRIGSKDSTKWIDAVEKALTENQRGTDDDDARGSWDPVDPWSRALGRVGTTALNALTLQTRRRASAATRDDDTAKR